MTDAPGIASAATALPSLHVTAAAQRDAWGETPRGLTARRVPAFDEDAVTLACDAARRALAGLDGRIDDVVCVTARSAPFASDLAAMLGLNDATTRDERGEAGAAVVGLASAADAARAGRRALFVAADVPTAAPGAAGALAEGGAAVAFVLAPGGRARLTGQATAARAVDAFAGIAAAAPSGPVVWAAGRAPRDLDAERAVASAYADVGDLGAASALVDVATAFGSASKGEHVAVVAATGTAATALAWVVDEPVRVSAPARAVRTVDLTTAWRHAGHFAANVDAPEEPMGAFVSLPDFDRSLPQRYRLEAQACAACGRVAFPPRPACLGCGGTGFASRPLTGHGEVATFTVIAAGAGPSEFALEQALTGAYVAAVVQLEEGPRVAARLADVGADDVAIGLAVEAVVRRLYRQQGRVRYGFKFRPRS